MIYYENIYRCQKLICFCRCSTIVICSDRDDRTGRSQPVYKNQAYNLQVCTFEGIISIVK